MTAGEGVGERERRGLVLLRLARQKLEQALEVPRSDRPQIVAEPWLEENGATFVTLKAGGELRGCIGTLDAHRSLRRDVCSNAHAAAFNDPRFSPLAADELRDLEIEVSLLSQPEPLEFESEEDLLAQLRPGIDGLVIEYGLHRGTFLPQVWEQLPDRRKFLQALKRKAGLDPDFWDESVRVSRYVVEKWGEGPEGLRA